MGSKLFAFVCSGLLLCALVVAAYVYQHGLAVLDGLAPVF